MKLMKTAQEDMVGCVSQPAPAQEGGADEGGGEADAEQDLDEEVVGVEHLGHHHCN